eukprot:365347-Chlamydomonas_euryale.AAC.32
MTPGRPSGRRRSLDVCADAAPACGGWWSGGSPAMLLLPAARALHCIDDEAGPNGGTGNGASLGACACRDATNGGAAAP